jgi:hypothetical protein
LPGRRLNGIFAAMAANAEYRDAHRREHIGPSYSGKAHLAFAVLFSLGGIALCAWQLEQVQPLEWLTTANVALLFVIVALGYPAFLTTGEI